MIYILSVFLFKILKSSSVMFIRMRYSVVLVVAGVVLVVILLVVELVLVSV